MFEIKNKIYSVGCLNPNMRIFDIVMRTEFGTSYNSYIVKGNSKIALIDGCHETFTSQYMQNIEEVTPINKIDYLVVNHCEPDHTGALRILLKKVPNVKILTTPSGNIFLRKITNLPLNIQVVKNNETVDLGGKTLQFLFAPFLHWPDSMFTYVKEDKTVFTCDFLGSHYCEPNMIDTKITYPKAYDSSLKLYYDVIFSPFKQYVNNGIAILEKLDLTHVCASHGPILTTTGKYHAILNLYKEWSKIEAPVTMVPIFYVSSYGYTRQIAEKIAESIKKIKPEIVTAIYDANVIDLPTLSTIMNSVKTFCVGCPTLNKNALPPIVNLLNSVDLINNKDQNVLIFGSYGWSGEAQEILTSLTKSLKMKPFEKGIHIRFAPDLDDLKTIENTTVNFLNTI